MSYILKKWLFIGAVKCDCRNNSDAEIAKVIAFFHKRCYNTDRKKDDYGIF